MSISYQALTGLLSIVADNANIGNINANNITTTDIDVTSLTPNTLVFADAVKKLISVNLTAGSNLAVTSGSGTVSIGTVANPTFTSTTSTLGYHSAGSYTVNSAMTTAQIQAVISDLNYSIIRFEKGTYTLTAMLNVNRSNIILDGNNCTLFLGNAIQEPCIFIGDIVNNPPVVMYSNITVKNFIINGNKANQVSETSITHPWIYSNCIGVNLCQYVNIQGCELFAARSGGFTATYNSKFITIDSCSAHDNYFDGLTAYGSESIRFTNNMCYNHSNGAGLSIDTDVFYCVISNNNFNNNKLGVFARFSSDLTFTGNTVCANSTHGFFLSGYNQTPNDQGCDKWTITGNSIGRNGGHGIFMQGCNDFTITGNTIYNNNNGINMTSYAGLPFATYGTCSRMNICGNTINGNLNFGIYNDATNSYTNGSRDNFLSTNTVKNNVVSPLYGDFSSWTIIDDTRVESVKVSLRATSGNYANLYSSSTGNCALVFPPSDGSANAIFTTDGAGNARWDNTATLNSATVGSGTTTVNLNINGLSSTLGAGVVSAGTAQAVPTNPDKWVVVNVNGTNYAIPLFHQALI